MDREVDTTGFPIKHRAYQPKAPSYCHHKGSIVCILPFIIFIIL